MHVSSHYVKFTSRGAVERIREPLNERSRRTRVSALDAAWELLEERGVDQTTMAAVADRAGVSRRALYLHFASRAELLLALHDHVDERLDLSSSLRPVLEAPDAVTALEEFAAHIARYHARTLRVDLALLRAKADDPDVDELVGQAVQRWHAGCQGVAQRLADEGRLAEPWTVDEAADLLWSLMFPDGIERLTVDRGWPLDRYGELLSILLRRTLVTPDGG
jgi:AcrR family transcriptional regulator